MKDRRILFTHKLLYPKEYKFKDNDYVLNKINFFAPNGRALTTNKIFPILEQLKKIEDNLHSMITLNNEIKELENKEHFTEVHKLTLIVKELLIKATNDSIKNGLQLEEELQTIFKTIYFRPRDDNLCLMSEDADRDGHFLTVEEYEVLDYQDIYIIFSQLKKKIYLDLKLVIL